MEPFREKNVYVYIYIYERVCFVFFRSAQPGDHLSSVRVWFNIFRAWCRRDFTVPRGRSRVSAILGISRSRKYFKIRFVHSTLRRIRAIVQFFVKM
jgi:hypothetical protein